jgi:hypothetical protein
MISMADQALARSAVHTESLGEMKEKKSYRRDTLVLVLPGSAIRVDDETMGKGLARAQIEASRNGARPSPLASCCLQQARSTKTGDRIGYLHWLPLEYPASHRYPQRCISQMPDFHKSLPTPGPLLGRD